MTRVIGKAPINCRSTPKVTLVGGAKPIRIESGGYCNGKKFTVYGDLSIDCVSVLIVELRKALRKRRDDQIRWHNNAVAEAERGLP